MSHAVLLLKFVLFCLMLHQWHGVSNVWFLFCRSDNPIEVSR